MEIFFTVQKFTVKVWTKFLNKNFLKFTSFISIFFWTKIILSSCLFAAVWLFFFFNEKKKISVSDWSQNKIAQPSIHPSTNQPEKRRHSFQHSGNVPKNLVSQRSPLSWSKCNWIYLFILVCHLYLAGMICFLVYLYRYDDDGSSIHFISLPNTIHIFSTVSNSIRVPG